MKIKNHQWSDIVHQSVGSKSESVSAGLKLVEKSREETRKKALEIRDKEDRRNMTWYCTR